MDGYPQPRSRPGSPAWARTTLISACALIAAIGIAALEGEPWLRGAPTLNLSFALGFLLAAWGSGIGLSEIWAELPLREAPTAQGSASDWWKPSVLVWICRALSAWPALLAPPPGEGPSRQLPACIPSLRLIASALMIFYTLLALGILLAGHGALDLLRWLIASAGTA